MTGDLICCNGKPVKAGQEGLPTDYMLSSNFVYQKIHVLGYKPLHIQAHLELLETAYTILYGERSGLTVDQLTRDTASLMTANRYPAGSNQVTIYLFPPEDGKSTPTTILSCEKQLLYKGYELWHTAEKAVVLPYEYPFPHFKTAASLAAHTYAAAYAARKGVGCAIAENNKGILYGVGENPLFAVSGNDIFTTSITDGACDGVERRLGVAAAENAGLNVKEVPISRGQLPDLQELFMVTPAGVTSIRECTGNIYSHSTAGRVAAEMKRLTDTTL